MVATSLLQNPGDRLCEIRDRLCDWREHARERPVGYESRVYRIRFDLLTIARDFGRRVQALLAGAVRSVTDDRVMYGVARDEILMIAARLGLTVDILDREIGIYGRSNEGIRLTMQLRLQAELLASLMTIPGVRLNEIDREAYQRAYSDDIDRDSIFDRLAEMADTSSDSEDWWSKLDGERIRACLSQEIPAFEKTLQELSDLVETFSVPQVSSNYQDQITAEMPQTGTDWSPSAQPYSDEVPSLEPHQCATSLVEPNPMSSASSSVEYEPGLDVVHAGTGRKVKAESQLESESDDSTLGVECVQDSRGVGELNSSEPSSESSLDLTDVYVANSAATDETPDFGADAHENQQNEVRHGLETEKGSVSEGAIETQTPQSTSSKIKKRLFECKGKKLENCLLICAYLEKDPALHTEIHRVLFERADRIGKRTLSVYCSHLKREGLLVLDKVTRKWSTTQKLIDTAKQKEPRLWALSRSQAAELTNSAMSSRGTSAASDAPDSR